MTDFGSIATGRFSHDVLLHHGQDELVDGIRAYVERGLGSGGHVMIHGTESHLATMRKVLGRHARLDYQLTSDLFRAPVRTLFSTQRRLAESRESREVWAAGTVPPVRDREARVRWTHYESLMNTVLGEYAYHALCTYDAQALSDRVIDVAKATHPWISGRGHRTRSREYTHAGEFLSTRLGGTPGLPDAPPALRMTLETTGDLRRGRDHVASIALSTSTVARHTVEDFVTSVNEVLVNGLQHGRCDVDLTLWVEPSRLICEIVDSGPGLPDPLAGCRYPEPSASRGLWVARQLCEDLLIRNLPGGGCSVLLTASEAADKAV